jgi:hypothetical protein
MTLEQIESKIALMDRTLAMNLTLSESLRERVRQIRDELVVERERIILNSRIWASDESWAEVWEEYFTK